MIETVKQCEIIVSIFAWKQEGKLKGLPGKLRRKPGYDLGFLFFSILLNCTLINCSDEQWHVIVIVELKMNHINLKCKNCARKDMCEYFRKLFFYGLSLWEVYVILSFFFFFQDILVFLEKQVLSHSLYTGKKLLDCLKLMLYLAEKLKDYLFCNTSKFQQLSDCIISFHLC